MDNARIYQPMNVNFGLFSPLHDRYRGYTDCAKADFRAWLRVRAHARRSA